MDKTPWENFLKQLVKTEHMIFVGILSALFIIIGWAHALPLTTLALLAIMPWGLYGMCSGVTYLVFYLFFLVWSKF